MSTRTITCHTLICDGPGPRGTGCDNELGADNESGPIHWPTAADARDAAPECRWITPDDGPDLCPRCQCRHDGHQWGEWDDVSDVDNHGFRFCYRCDAVQSAAPHGSGA